MTLFKSFGLGGDRRFQFRVGFFNLFNQAVPDVTQGDVALNRGSGGDRAGRPDRTGYSIRV